MPESPSSAEPAPVPAAPSPLLLSGPLLADGRRVDVRLGGGRIEAVGCAGSLSAPERIDLDGYLLLPAPAEPHTHLDAAYSAEQPEEPDLAADVQRRVIEGALTALGYGATAQRTHVRVGDVHGLARLEAALQAGQALRGLLDLQTVAQPRLLTGLAGADGRALLRDAAKAGATAVGGCPELDPDPAGYVEELLAVAAEFGCGVDLHTDGSDAARLARLTAALGPLRPRVALGPLSRLASPGAARAIAAAGAFAVCLPQSGVCAGGMEGWGGGAGAGGGGGGGAGAGVQLGVVGGGAGARTAGAAGVTGGAGTAGGAGAAGVRELRDAGVRVAAGSGGVRDLANPVGRADPLEAAFLLAAAGALSPAAAYGAVSAEARALMGLAPVRIDAGFPAELLAVRGESLAAALAGGHSRVVVHGGRVVSRTSAVREFGEFDTEPPAGVPRQGRGH